jgi:hypothetical protein
VVGVERAGAGVSLSGFKNLQKSHFFVSGKQNAFWGSCKMGVMQTNCICRVATFHWNAAKTTRACFQMDHGARACGPQQRRPRRAVLSRRNLMKADLPRRSATETGARRSRVFRKLTSKGVCNAFKHLLTPPNACVTEFNGLSNARISKINAH